MRARERAYEQLREDIVSGALKPGTVLAEIELAERLGLSRTPVREALSRLSAENLLSAQGARGVVVSSLSLADVQALFAYREALEAQTVKLAADAVSHQRASGERFEELAKRFSSAAEQLGAANATSAPVRPGFTKAYYKLSEQLDEAINEAAANPYLRKALTQLRPLLHRLRRIAQDNPDRLRASAHEHSAIARAIARGDISTAQAALIVHLNESLHSVERNGLEGLERHGQPPPG